MVLATWVSMAAVAALDMADLAAEKKEDIVGGWLFFLGSVEG